MEYEHILKIKSVLGKEEDPIKILIEKDQIAEWKKKCLTTLQNKRLPKQWADIGVIFEDPYIIILRDLVEFPGGYRNGYIRLFNRAYLEGGAAGVVVLPEQNGKLLIMRQFRHATRLWHWEIPRGFGEPGVKAEAQAEKEVQEEIQGKIAELFDLGTFYNNTGLEGHPVNLFLARMESVGEPEKAEGIEKLRWVSVPELERMIADGEITDGFTIAAYTKAKLKGLI